MLVHTDVGLVGLRETCWARIRSKPYVDETVAQKLRDKEPLQIDCHARALCGYLRYQSSGVETRGQSALHFAI